MTAKLWERDRENPVNPVNPEILSRRSPGRGTPFATAIGAHPVHQKS
jgi:hypothetical protein